MMNDREEWKEKWLTMQKVLGMYICSMFNVILMFYFIVVFIHPSIHIWLQKYIRYLSIPALYKINLREIQAKWGFEDSERGDVWSERGKGSTPVCIWQQNMLLQTSLLSREQT